jgi:hypothetical protein
MKEIISEELEQLGSSRTRKIALVHFASSQLKLLIIWSFFPDRRFAPF